MRCPNPECGKEITDTSQYCKYCGTKILPKSETIPQEPDDINPDPIDPFKPNDESSFLDIIRENKSIFIGACIGLVILILLILSVPVLLKPKKTTDIATENAAESTSEPQSNSSDPIAEDEPISVDTSDLSHVIEGIQFDRVDLSLQKHTPGQKVQGLDWDDTFFYRFEDVDITSDDNDNYIAKTKITEYCFETDSGRLLCEVYSDPVTSEIYKIVSIAGPDSDGLLDITDYYYQDGKPYFIFDRKDSLYTPTYATLDKPGMRYYFMNDVLVRSRMVVEGTLKVSQTSLVMQNKKQYEEFDYFKAPAAVKQQYDAFESEWLNKAYNILEAVQNSSHAGQISGTVVDLQGNPIDSAEIYVQDTAAEQIIYHCKTDRDGSFSVMINRDPKEYRIYVTGGNTFRDSYINAITPNENTVFYDIGVVILTPQGESTCNVVLNVYDGDLYDTSNAKTPGIPCHLRIRRGFNTKEGACVFDGDTDANGRLEASLDQDNYTVEATCNGYSTVYINITVINSNLEKSLYLVKAPEQNKAKVLITWDGDIDLDLTIFTPYQGTFGNMEHIGGYSLQDTHGNYIAADNSRGCEVGYIDLGKAGDYKIYVSDYTDIFAGLYGEQNLAGSNVRIYIFYPDGRMEVCEIDRTAGVVWEAVKISGINYVAYNQVHTSLGGKTWWIANKTVVSAQQNTEYKTGMQITGRLGVRYNYADPNVGGYDYKYYVMYFDTPVKIYLEDIEGQTVLDELSEIALNTNYESDIGLDLSEGQYVTGKITSANYTPQGQPLISLDSMTFIQNDLPKDNVVVPAEYKSLLSDLLKDREIAYNLVYINNNSTPELVVFDPEMSHASTAAIYSYDYGKVCCLGTFGSFGGDFTYYPMQNLIRSYTMYQGWISEDLTQLRGNVVHIHNFSYYYEDISQYGYIVIDSDLLSDSTNRSEEKHLGLQGYASTLKDIYKNIDITTAQSVGIGHGIRAKSINDIKFN
nr:zinc-ribbon domain-containing protein [uncultured Butyrivibrio sp.]